MPACEFCNSRFDSTKGLNLHQAQSKPCREKRDKLFEAQHVSDSESSDGNDVAGPDHFAGDELCENNWDNMDVEPPFAEAGAGVEAINERTEAAANACGDEGSTKAAENGQRKRKRQDSGDREETGKTVWQEIFPGPAGTPISKCRTRFEEIRAKQIEKGREPWYPFESKAMWELARWLVDSGLSADKINSFLKLELVSMLLFEVYSLTDITR